MNGFPGYASASKYAGLFVGSDQCSQCHTGVYAAWQGSDHHRAMLPATGANVLGDFNDARLKFHGIETRLYRQGEDFRVTTAGLDGKPGGFEVRYTFILPLPRRLTTMHLITGILPLGSILTTVGETGRKLAQTESE